MSNSVSERHGFLERLERATSAISLIIAGISLLATITQTFNYRKSIDTIQRNVLRTENLKTCRDIIELFFDFRLKAEEANAASIGPAPDREEAARMKREMKAVVYRFGALGTHLANFSPEQARERYAKLSWALNDIAEKAMLMPAIEFEARFAEADKAFAELNEDCVQSTRVGN